MSIPASRVFWLLRTARWVLLVALWVSVALPAYAQDADAAFEAGMKHMAAGDYSAACASFKKSEVPEPTMASRYQLGSCNEKRGRFASARQAYLDAAALADKQGDAKRAKVARARAKEMDDKVPLLLVVVGAKQLVEGLTVLHNGEEVPAERWNTPMKVDPGEQLVRFAAPGYKAVTLKLEVIEAGEVTRAVAPTLSRNGAAATGGADAADRASTGGPNALFWTGLGLGVGGAVLAVVGVADLAQPPVDVCDGLCEVPVYEEKDNTLAILGLALGGTLLAVGVPLMIVGWDDADEGRAVAVSVQALVGPTSAGLRVQF